MLMKFADADTGYELHVDVDNADAIITIENKQLTGIRRDRCRIIQTNGNYYDVMGEPSEVADKINKAKEEKECPNDS